MCNTTTRQCKIFRQNNLLVAHNAESKLNKAKAKMMREQNPHPHIYTYRVHENCRKNKEVVIITAKAKQVLGYKINSRKVNYYVFMRTLVNTL